MSEPDPDSLQCVHEDASLLVFDKPAGLPSVPGRTPALQDCVLSRALRRWPEALVVHRLDMATSGLLLLARGAAAQRQLSRAFATRAVRKHYVAVVDDPQARLHPSPDAAGTCDGWQRIELPLSADWPRRPRQRVDPLGGKASLTLWRPLGHRDGRSWLELEPHTGRTHQLRVHLAAIGHPILGDSLYADDETAGATVRLMLHAQRLAFVHPANGQEMHLESPCPFPHGPSGALGDDAGGHDAETP